MEFLIGFLLTVTAVFLIMIVLLQRGRGGGLAGALGGSGGQSAFGAKAGDLFTRITIGVATFWILLCIASVKILNRPTNFYGTGSGSDTKAPAAPGATSGTPTSTGGKTGPASTASGDKAGSAGATEGGTKPAGAGGATSEKPAGGAKPNAEKSPTPPGK